MDRKTDRIDMKITDISKIQSNKTFAIDLMKFGPHWKHAYSK